MELRQLFLSWASDYPNLPLPEMAGILQLPAVGMGDWVRSAPSMRAALFACFPQIPYNSRQRARLHSAFADRRGASPGTLPEQRSVEDVSSAPSSCWEIRRPIRLQRLRLLRQDRTASGSTRLKDSAIARLHRRTVTSTNAPYCRSGLKSAFAAIITKELRRCEASFRKKRSW